METHSARQLLIQIVKDASGSDDVTLESRLDALDIDSLDFIVILQDVRKQLGAISDEDAQKCALVGDILDAIEW